MVLPINFSQIFRNDIGDKLEKLPEVDIIYHSGIPALHFNGFGQLAITAQEPTMTVNSGNFDRTAGRQKGSTR